MRRWTARLSLSFIVSAAGFSGYVFSQSPEGQAIAASFGASSFGDGQPRTASSEAAQDIIDRATAPALERLMQTAREGLARDAVRIASANIGPSAELPFQVVATAAADISSDPYRRNRRSSPIEMNENESAEAPRAFERHETLAPVAAPRPSPQVLSKPAPEASLTSEPMALPDPKPIAMAPSVVTTPFPARESLADETAPSADAKPVSEKPDIQLADGMPNAQTDLDPVEARVLARVPQDLRKYFDLYLYVSKADKGDWSQRMYVLAKQPNQSLSVVHKWRVSTGKELPMVNPHGQTLETDTPEGFFRLDRARFFEDYTSRQWKSPMPFAMFFDWIIEGRVSGLAIHGTDEKGVAELGRRASHGCIRMRPEDARVLYKLITENYEGTVPQLKVDPVTGTQSTNGLMRRDAEGRIRTKWGFRVLVVIENYGGPTQDTIATIM